MVPRDSQKRFVPDYSLFFAINRLSIEYTKKLGVYDQIAIDMYIG